MPKPSRNPPASSRCLCSPSGVWSATAPAPVIRPRHTVAAALISSRMAILRSSRPLAQDSLHLRHLQRQPKAPGEQLFGIRYTRQAVLRLGAAAGGGVQDDTDQSVTVAFGGEDQAAASRASPAGFDAQCTFISDQHGIGIFPVEFPVIGSGCKRICGGADNFGEERDAYGVVGQAHKVVGCGVMLMRGNRVEIEISIQASGIEE